MIYKVQFNVLSNIIPPSQQTSKFRHTRSPHLCVSTIRAFSTKLQVVMSSTFYSLKPGVSTIAIMRVLQNELLNALMPSFVNLHPPLIGLIPTSILAANWAVLYKESNAYPTIFFLQALPMWSAVNVSELVFIGIFLILGTLTTLNLINHDPKLRRGIILAIVFCICEYLDGILTQFALLGIRLLLSLLTIML